MAERMLVETIIFAVVLIVGYLLMLRLWHSYYQGTWRRRK